MSRCLVVVDDPSLLPAELAAVDPATFLAEPELVSAGTVVVNLCAECHYLSSGWYVSLLAEARGGRPLPEASMLEQARDRPARDRALREEGIDVIDPTELAERVRLVAEQGGQVGDPVLIVDDPDEPRPRPATADERLSLRVLAGRPWPATGPAGAPSFARLARRVFSAWPLPLVELTLVRDARRWRLLDLRVLDLGDLGDDERQALATALTGLRGPAVEAEDPTPSLAVLWDGADPSSASSAETIDRLARIGRTRGLRVERLGLSDLQRLGEHDALFIRCLTGVDQPAWRFATRAEALGMPVIDDPSSIVRCGNKVYLHELLSRSGVATPPTVIFGREASWQALTAELGQPLIVKVPDGSFSSAVFKVVDADDFEQRVPPLLVRSPLLVAQAWLPTAYDWRVGVLDGRVLYVARYHMVAGHWQIRSGDGAALRFGRVEAVARAAAPADVKRVAIAAAGLIGDGFFGVDVKPTDDGPVVIEVNDNANLDLGYEDGADGDVIYEELVAWFLARLDPSLRPAPRVRTRKAASPRRRPVDTLRQPIGRAPRPETRPYRAYEVMGLELEYAVVDRDLNVLPVVEDALATLAGRRCSDVELGRVGISNEIVDHVLEVKNVAPQRSLLRLEQDLVEGVRRLSLLLDRHHRARLLPGGMHPWFDPARARLWRRSNRRIYDTYARLFDVHSHGWANVQALHVNLPLGSPEEATAMMNAARLLVPYLPALAASSPLVEGERTGAVDNRVTWLLEHQARLPQSMARLVPEPLQRYADYRQDVLAPMYAAVDLLPDAAALRHEFLNARGAVFKASRNSMEVRILDVQECVAMDVALAWFVRRALRWLAGHLVSLPAAPQPVLEADLLAVARSGSRARVQAPFVPGDRDPDGTLAASAVVGWLYQAVARRLPEEEQRYADLLQPVVEHGSLSERILLRLSGLEQDPAFTEGARRVWLELADCLVDNRPWAGRR